MPKVLLLTYDVESKSARIQYFQGAGFTVADAAPSWPAAYEKAQKFGPDVIAVDCAQLPSHCRETAESLRSAAATRSVPVVLFRVAEHDVERTRLKVPGGVVAYEYELLDRLRSAALTRMANQAQEESAAAKAAEEKRLARRSNRAAASAKQAAEKKPAEKKPAPAKKPVAKKPAKAAPKKAGKTAPAKAKKR